MNEQQLVKLNVDITRPATVLIEKVAEAIGIVYAPTHRRRMAKAEAEAAVIEAKAQTAITELHQWTICRRGEELGHQQANIESIIGQAIPMLEDQSTPEQMENDWIVNFFDKSKNVSDEEMQQL